MGKGTLSGADASRPMDPLCMRTTKLVLGLMEKFHLLDKGHRVYMDNYYTSLELFEELYFRETYACGTVRMNGKSMPIRTLKHVNVKPLESAFLRNGPLLCLKWKGAKTKKTKKPSYFIVYNS